MGDFGVWCSFRVGLTWIPRWICHNEDRLTDNCPVLQMFWKHRKHVAIKVNREALVLSRLARQQTLFRFQAAFPQKLQNTRGLAARDGLRDHLPTND